MTSVMGRILKLQNRGVTRDVPVRVFWPAEEKAAWDCRWEIEWPDGPRTNSGRGVDAIQALMNALTMIGAEIYSSEAHKVGALTWTDDWSGYGFSVTNNLRDMLVGDDRKFL